MNTRMKNNKWQRCDINKDAVLCSNCSLSSCCSCGRCYYWYVTENERHSRRNYQDARFTVQLRYVTVLFSLCYKHLCMDI